MSKPKLSKGDLIASAVGGTGPMAAQGEKLINRFLDLLAEAVIGGGNDVILRGFGTFSLKESPERIARNPATGERVTVPASRSMKFKAAKAKPPVA